MGKKFIVSRNNIDFEIYVDGVVKVSPIPHKTMKEETVHVIAKKHEVVIEWNWIKNNKHDLLEVAVDYFKNRGFEIKDK